MNTQMYTSLHHWQGLCLHKYINNLCSARVYCLPSLLNVFSLQQVFSVCIICIAYSEFWKHGDILVKHLVVLNGDTSGLCNLRGALVFGQEWCFGQESNYIYNKTSLTDHLHRSTTPLYKTLYLLVPSDCLYHTTVTIL